MKKKLIYILNHYSSNSAQHFFHIIHLLEEMSAQGIDIALIIEKCDDELILKNSNISLYKIETRFKFLRPFILFRTLFLLNKNGYHKVFIRISQFAAITAILLSWIKKLDVYFWHSGTVFEFNKNQPLKVRIRNYFKSKLPFDFIKKQVTYFVTGPESMKEYYVKQCNINPNKILILYNDIDTKRFSPYSQLERQKAKENLGIPHEAKVLLFVHRLSPVRETLYYLPYVLDKFYETTEAASYQTIIIGDGSDLPMLKKLIQENATLKTKVHLLGDRPNSMIQDYYAIADIFLNPTMAEGFPRVLIEAMAMGLPIVTTDAGGIKDILPQKQLEFMVDKLERDLFAEKLIKMAQSDDLKKQLADENLHYIEKFSTESVAQMYCNKIFT